MTVDEYAIDLVVSGAQHVAEDDLNEDGEIAEEQHGEAMDLALSMAATIRDNPAAFLAWFEAHRREPGAPVVHLEECEPEDHSDWVKVTYGEALNLGGATCEQTRYMANELFPDEMVWMERTT